MAEKLGRILILGLDGCTFDILKPWAEKGILPNFAKLMENAAWGHLASTYPPLTMPAWVSFSTGKNPGRFGIYGFVSFLDGTYELKHNTHYHVRDQLEFWDILNAYGLTCGILNYPLMDRPVRLDGYCVPGFMAHELSYKTYPEDLREELDSRVGKYELDARGSYILDLEQLTQNALRVMDKRADAIIHLLKRRPVDVFLGIFTMTDRVLHRMYNMFGPGWAESDDPAENPLAFFFQALDSRIGEILEILDDDDFLFIISDHGFSHADRAFFINNWLKEKGYLRWKGKGFLSRLGITQNNVGRVMYKLRLYKRAQLWAPSFLRKAIPPGRNPSHSGVNIIDIIYEDRIDWKNTKAIAIGNGPTAAIYLNTIDRPKGILDPREANDVCEEIISLLRSEDDPETGEKVDVNVRLPEELYMGERLLDVAKFYIDFGGDLLPSPSISEKGKVFGLHSIHSHAMDGIFLAAHPWIEAGEYQDLTLLDIIPTILHLYDIPLPDEVDGRVLLEIFHEDSDPLSRPVKKDKGPGVKDMLERERIARVAGRLKGGQDI